MTRSISKGESELLREIASEFLKFDGVPNTKENRMTIESLIYKTLNNLRYESLRLQSKIDKANSDNWRAIIIAFKGNPIILISRELYDGKISVNIDGVKILILDESELIDMLYEFIKDSKLGDDERNDKQDEQKPHTSSLFTSDKIDLDITSKFNETFKSKPFTVKPKQTFRCKTCNAEYDEQAHAERCYNEGHFNELQITNVKFNPKEITPNEVEITFSDASNNKHDTRKCTYIRKEE